MILLDTDILTLVFQGNATVQERLRSVEEPIAITIITRIEVLRGHFDAIFKATDADQLRRASRRLLESEGQLQTLAMIPIDDSVAEQFEQLLRIKSSEESVAAIC
jgi:predicted nucleic acid-binding protein